MVRRKSDDELVELFAEIEHETELAYKLFDGVKTHAWVPKSQVKQISDGLFAVPGWLIKVKGFQI